MENNDSSRDSRWGGMATFGALMGGIPGLLMNFTGNLLFSLILVALFGIIFWVGVGLVLDEI